VHRFDANANLIWTKTYGGEEREVINDIVELKNGGFIFTAEKYQPNKKEGEALTLVKIAQDGKLAWKKVIDETGQETEGFSLKQLSDGLSVTGMIKSASVVSDAFFNMRSEEQHLYLLKIDNSGKKLWSKQLHFSANPIASTASDMLIDDKNNFVISGNMTLKGKTDKKIERPSKEINQLESRRALLLKANAKGNAVWAKSYEIGSITMGCVVKKSRNGGFMIAGNTLLGLNDIEIFLMETDADGNVKWVKTYGSKSFESIADITETKDGGWLVATITTVNSSSFDDILLIKTDSIGKVKWSKTLGSKNEDYPSRILKRSDQYLIAGSTGGFDSKSFDVLLFSIDNEGKSCVPGSDIEVTERVAKVKIRDLADASMKDVKQGIIAPNVKRISSENIEQNNRKPIERNLCK